ncbi:MAG TPA: DUF5011 domain-containing protein [Puia sp.]|nr:DUF5011 domain-containing protein [Puia sp.]
MKISYLFLSLLLTGSFLSCNKFTASDPKGPPAGAKIIYFPVITRVGLAAMSVVKGTPFTDPGVKAEVNGQAVPVTIDGTVNTAEVGPYTLTYTASNKDGYQATATRIVWVIPGPETSTADFSGTYAPVGGSAPANAVITKLDKGLYYTSNCWGGGSSVTIAVYFFCLDGTTLTVPEQVTTVGHVKSTPDGTYVGGLITWTIDREDFQAGGLILTKKWQKQ